MRVLELDKTISPRLYQQSIFANSLNKNSLVVLPTGLGKTLVAIMLSIYYFNKKNHSILFMAPTKPLVEQQEKAFKQSIKGSFSTQVLTGQVSPQKRENLYDTDLVFSTPQLIENDVLNKRLDLKKYDLVIFDECHRATGNYAYTFIAEQCRECKVPILALSASPGSSHEEIKTLISNLYIEQIEVKKYDDPDVQPYVKETDIRRIEVELPEAFKKIRTRLQRVVQKRLEALQECGFLKGKAWNTVTKRELLDLQTQLRIQIGKGTQEQEVWNAISLAAALMKLQYGIELFESQELSATYTYFHNFFRDGGDSSKAVKELLLDLEFRDAFEEIQSLYKQGKQHPKLPKLKELIQYELNKQKNLKMIIFNQYRDSAQTIVKELSQVKGLKPVLFVGQAKKGEIKLSQKEQKEILERFRNDEYNILVSTSVGEEGLDIPKVDLVIFYEPIPSAIRSIQRVGRTGRFEKGKAYILQTKGTRDIVTNHIATAREKRMYRVLDEIRDQYQNAAHMPLSSFIDTAKEEKDKSITTEKDDDTQPTVFVDTRENSDLVKLLFKLPLNVHTKRLDIGDIVISDHVAIERKSKIDFVNSILDKRLFPQLMDLSRNFRRPVLIIEGEENIFSLRNLNPNAIRATLSSIAVDLRIPIIYTDSIEETAHMILNLAKRTIKTKKDVSLVADKRSFSENEELEKFVSTIPKVNVVSAKSILSHFRSIKELVNASEKQLLEVEGLGKVRARYLKGFFEREYKQL